MKEGKIVKFQGQLTCFSLCVYVYEFLYRFNFVFLSDKDLENL